MRTTSTPAGTVAYTADGIALTASWPRIVLYVRGGSDNLRRFRKAVAHRGCGLENPDGAHDTGGTVAFVAYGLPGALRSLLLSPLVKSWHYTTDQRVPFRAAGAGEERPRSKAAPPPPPPLMTDKERRGFRE